MEIDVARHIGAIERTVRTEERDGRTARVAVASRTFATTQEDVWDALTSPERIPRWFLPISGDLRLGGRYQLEGHVGGEITGCEPPSHLALTWENGDDVSWVVVRLEPAPSGGTRLELEHIAHVPEEFWPIYGPGAVGVGWDSTLLGLALHVETGASNDPAESMAWLSSDNGKAFIRASSDGWCRASIAAGSDPTEAAAAAERTRAAYTGEEDASTGEGDGGTAEGERPPAKD